MNMIKKTKKKLVNNKKKLPPHIEKFYKDTGIVNSPFFLRGNKKGILLIHGWSSTPYEMRALGEYLHKKGFSVYAPLLSGHGTKPEDLEPVKWKDWVKDVFLAYDKLKKECDEVFVGGMSFGGTLALILASKKQVSGLFLMSTPYRIRYEKILYLLWRATCKRKKYKSKSYPKILGNKDMCLTQMISYQRYPINSLYQAFYTIKVSLTHLNKITSPTMIIQSRDDHVISGRSMKKLEKNLNSRFIKKRKIKNAYHNFIGDSKNNYIFDEIIDFIKECEK